MNDNNMISPAVDTYQRLFPELKQRVAGRTAPVQVQIQDEVASVVTELIEMIQPLPPQSTLLGVCEDGAPFLLDLAGQETGALLITGDSGCGITRHLQATVAATILLNAPHEVQIAVLTRDPEKWKPLANMPGGRRHFSGIYAWYEQGAIDLIDQLINLADDRSSDRRTGATVLLVIDDLSGVFNAGFEAQNGLHRLLVDGPFSHIRPIASLDAQLCTPNPFWVDAFRTFLIGKVASGDTFKDLGFSLDPGALDLVDGLEFSAFTGQEWMKYRVPTLDF